MMLQREVKAADGEREIVAMDCKDGGLRMALARLCGRWLETEELAMPRPAVVELMKAMFNDVALLAIDPSRSFLDTLTSFELTALDALRMSSANFLV
jgi:hypothetical protein